jgi:hypothetical protein
MKRLMWLVAAAILALASVGVSAQDGTMPVDGTMEMSRNSNR